MTKKTKNSHKQLSLSLRDNIGESGAEDDNKLLSKCFYHHDAFDIIGDVSDPRSILIGGTGVGKTALLEQFYKNNKSKCVRLELDDVSLTYLSNSNILNELENQGINLNVLYLNLWRHFLATQLLKKRLETQNSSNSSNVFMKIRKYFYNKNLKSNAEDYLERLESDFLLEPSDCIQKNSREIIQTLEGTAGISSFVGVGCNGTNQNKVETTEKKNIQKAIDGEGLQILSKVLNFLNEQIFTDSQNPYFVLIDELDTSWVEKNRKYHLIRALIETVRTFRKVTNIKIIVALRTDLYDRIINATKDEGFQHEKHNTFLLPIQWQKNQLFELVDKRINEVFKSHYTKQAVNFHSITPEKVSGRKCFDYIIERTFNRPRHVILFFNACILESQGKSKFTQQTIKEAERIYSNQRLQAIKDEWGESFNFIDQTMQMLEMIGLTNFEIGSIEKDITENIALLICDQGGKSDFDFSLKKYAEEAFNEDCLKEKFLANTFKMLFQLGIIGIKPSSNESYSWNIENPQHISASQFSKSTSVKIHPMFWRTLGINSNQS